MTFGIQPPTPHGRLDPRWRQCPQVFAVGLEGIDRPCTPADVQRASLSASPRATGVIDRQTRHRLLKKDLFPLLQEVWVPASPDRQSKYFPAAEPAGKLCG